MIGQFLVRKIGRSDAQIGKVGTTEDIKWRPYILELMTLALRLQHHQCVLRLGLIFKAIIESLQITN